MVLRQKEKKKETCNNNVGVPQLCLELDRSQHLIVSVIKDFAYLGACLQENMRIQRLLLDENGLDEDGMESLANGLRDNVTLSYLVRHISTHVYTHMCTYRHAHTYV